MLIKIYKVWKLYIYFLLSFIVSSEIIAYSYFLYFFIQNLHHCIRFPKIQNNTFLKIIINNKYLNNYLLYFNFDVVIIFRLNYSNSPLILRFVTEWSFKLFWLHISPLNLRFVTDWSFKLFWSQISPLSL